MDLYLLRHGLAVERGTPGIAADSDRPLTDKGKRKLRQIAKAMRLMELSFDLILHSPYSRARQTAALVAKAFQAKKILQSSELLTPDGSRVQLIGFLNHLEPQPQSILLVGHEPYLSELIAWLISANASVSVVMKKGGLAKLSTNSLRQGGCANLEWLLTPRQMGLIASKKE